MEFKYVSGRRCLDFAGTLKHRGGANSEELLVTPQRLAQWANQANLVDTEMRIDEGDLAAAIALREAIYGVVTALLQGHRPARADVRLINEHAARPQLALRLHPDGSVTRDGVAAQLLAGLAADLLDLIAGPDMAKVKGCSHDGCTRLYLDASRAQNRHWCGMSTCGNRAKVQAFRARQRASTR